jgi:2-amino-4-hydroxy-6-hydroxymethyldihydropteridine diphosphokinase
MAIAYLSLGSNLGDREHNLCRAIRLITDDLLRVTRASGLYETAPMEFADQPGFLNQVVEVDTVLIPRELLARIAHVEAELGRQRTVPKGPRTADIDILLYNSLIVDSPDLVIPHPAMHQRRFVLEPLAALAPDLVHPLLRRTIRSLRKDTLEQIVEPYHQL